MRNAFLFAFVALMGSGVHAPAEASSVSYEISGTASGRLAGTTFRNAAYEINLSGDSSNLVVQSPTILAIDPLLSASISIAGFSTVTFTIATRFGTFNGTSSFFSRAGNSLDLLDFYTSSPVDLLSNFGPILGTNIFALNQFVDVATSGGDLTISSSSNVQFSGEYSVSSIPLPASAPMFGVALLSLGALGYGLKRTSQVGT